MRQDGVSQPGVEHDRDVLEKLPMNTTGRISQIAIQCNEPICFSAIRGQVRDLVGNSRNTVTLSSQLAASVDKTGADWRHCDSRGGVADRSAQVLASNLTYPSRYLFTQTDPYPRAAILPELAFGAIIGTVALIDCVPLEKVSTCSRIGMLALPAN